MPEIKSVTEPHDLLIDALGTKFFISTIEDPAFLDKVLTQYQADISKTKGIPGMKDKDPLKISILTGFMLCAEINKLKIQIEKEQTDIEQEINRITKNLIDSIDHVMEESSSLNE
jgi:cell division protein ZapA (FtsZ GTPase activity inhibitor)